MRVFLEQQRFTQTWLIVLISVSTIAPLAIVINAFLKEKSTMSLTELIVISISLILCLGIIFVFKLKTRIDEKGIHYQFFPFHLSYKTITWQEINKAHIRKYDAISEYGGWGLKGGALWNKKNGKAINVKGDLGIQLELKNNKKLLIGTQKPNDAQQTITHYLKK
jgi:hypothetical protein